MCIYYNKWWWSLQINKVLHYISLYIYFLFICNIIIKNLSKYSYVFPQKECIMPQKSTTHTAGDDSIPAFHLSMPGHVILRVILFLKILSTYMCILIFLFYTISVNLHIWQLANSNCFYEKNE